MFFFLPHGHLFSQSHIFGLGLPMVGSPAPSPVTPRHRSTTAGSDDCTIFLPVDCEGQEEWHMTTVGLEGAPTSQRMGTKPTGKEVLISGRQNQGQPGPWEMGIREKGLVT